MVKCIGWALALLALAYPHAAGRVLAALGVVGSFVFGHFAAACVLTAVALVASVPLRWHFGRRARRRFWLGVMAHDRRRP